MSLRSLPLSRVLIGPLIALAAAALPSLASAETPRLVVGRDGEVEVIFREHDCVVTFDARGRERYHGSRCEQSQVAQARDAMQRYRREQGLDRPGSGNDDDRTPRVSINGDGSGRVDIGDCRVQYDRRGRRIGNPRDCSDRQLERADRAMEAYRREQGQDRPGGGDGDRDRTPRVTINGDGSGRVDIGDCRVQYDRRGRRIGNPRDCSDRQLERADRAMEAYRREQGQDRPGSGNDDERTPRVSVNGDGSGRVDIGDCRVQYDRQGRRTGNPRDCSARQLVRADEAMAAHRREHGLDGDRPSYGVGGSGSLRGETTFNADGGVVRFRSSGCAVNFDKEGIPQGSSGRCSSAQEREAAKIYNKARILRQSIDQKGSGA